MEYPTAGGRILSGSGSASKEAAPVISRRGVVRAAAWSAPVIAAAIAAPLASASCVSSTSFDTLKVGSRPERVTFSPSGVGATLSYASSGQGYTNTPGDTGRVAETNTRPAWKYIELELVDPLHQGDYVELTIKFDEEVTGLSFVLHDIDSTTSGWEDTVWVRTVGYTYQLGSNIQGTGTQDKPFRPVTVGDTPISSGQGDVRLTWAGSVSQVVIRYIAGKNGSSQNQHIGLGNLSHDVECAPATGISSANKQRLAATQAQESVPLYTGEVIFSESDGLSDS